MELIDQLDTLMLEHSGMQLQDQSKSIKSQLNISQLKQLTLKNPQSLFQSQLQTSYAQTTLSKTTNLQLNNSLTKSITNNSTSQTDQNIVEILKPVKFSFINGNFVLKLNNKLTSYSCQDLEAEIGQFYLDQCRQVSSEEESNQLEKFLKVQIFTRSLTKYIIKIQKIPKYNLVSAYQSQVQNTSEIVIPQKELINIIKTEFVYERMVQQKPKLQQEAIKQRQVIKESQALQTTNRLYREHFVNKEKLERQIKQKQLSEISTCTFIPETNNPVVEARYNNDFGVNKYIQKQQKLQKQDMEETIEELIVKIKEEAQFFSIKLSQEFIDEVYEDLNLAQESHLQNKIVDKIKNLFHKKYMQVQSKEIKRSISSGKMRQLQTDFTKNDSIFIQSQQNQDRDYDTKLALARIQKQNKIDEEQRLIQLKREQLNIKEQQALIRSRIAKQGMKGGGAFKLDFTKHQENAKETLLMSAEAIRNVANGGVVTLWTAAGSVRK